MDRSGLVAWLASEELKSLDTDQKNILEALERKAEEIERENVEGLLEIDSQTQGLMRELEKVDEHLAAVQGELQGQLQSIHSLRTATSSLEEKSTQIQLTQSNRVKLVQVIEQYLQQ